MANKVDNRVVKMVFDNSQFNNNIQSSIDSLDKFKESLNFKDASKGFDELDKLGANLDFSKMEASLAKIERRVDLPQPLGPTIASISF